MKHITLSQTCGLLLLSFAACSHDTELPPVPGPGSVTGRVLLAEPGRVEKRPVEGAEVRVLGSGLATSTTPAGTFTLGGVEQTSGLLLVRVELGGVTRQRVLQLADYDTGPRRQVNLGDLVIGENARVRGRALRGDLATSGGHGGTTVFVPAGPFTAITNDDGSYAFEQLPEGPLELAIFRAGYGPVAVGVLELRSGETAELRDVFLQRSATSEPGGLHGRLAFLPEAAGAGDAALRLTSPEATVAATVSDDGAFVFASVPAGLYRLVASRTGYTTLEVANVLVVSGQDSDVGLVTLTTAPAFDAGPPPPPPPDAGSGDPDAGADAGTGDAGTMDAGTGGRLCTLQADCDMGQWCDRGRCVPLCVSNADCGFGRVCDLAVTRTCLTSCVGQCPAGQACSAANVCEAICDATFPCPSGQRCSAGACVPECATSADCGSPFLSCDLGACRRNGTCASDLDCAREQLCIAGQCGARPTNPGVPADGGTWLDGGALFACAQACHCRVGERCLEGFCQPDVLPTRFVALDGGGAGTSPDAPGGDLRAAIGDGGQVVALLGAQTWDLGTQTVGLPSGTQLAGGFTACGPGRWVRHAGERTVLTGTGSGGSDLTPLLAAWATNASTGTADLSLSGLTLRTTGTARCGYGAGLAARYTTRLTLEDVDVDLRLGACNLTGVTYGLRLEAASSVTARRVRLVGVTSGGQTGTGLLDLGAGSGVLEDISTLPFQVTANQMRVLSVRSPVGPVTLRRLSLARFTNSPSSTENSQIVIESCAATPVVVEDALIEFPVSLVPNYGGSSGLRAADCSALSVRRFAVTSAGHPGGLYNQNYGLNLANSGGSLTDVSIELPAATQPVSRTTGVLLLGPRASFNASRIAVRGSGGTGTDNLLGSVGIGMVGVRLDGVDTGPLALSNVDVSLRGNIAPHGVIAINGFGAGAEVSLVDSRVEVEGTNTCSADVIGMLLRESMRVERTVVSASRGALAAATWVATNASRAELYGNSLRAGQSSGSSTCGSRTTGLISGSYGLVVDGALTDVRAVGNSIEAAGQVGQSGNTLGLACGGTPKVTFASNVVATGAGGDARLLSFLSGASTGTGCFTPANFERNYFFTGAATPVSASERLFDAGIPLDGGAFFGGTTSCFAAPVAQVDGGPGFPHYLVAGSACADRGVLGVSIGGVTLDTDLFGRPRDGGAGPDIGAVEGP